MSALGCAGRTAGVLVPTFLAFALGSVLAAAPAAGTVSVRKAWVRATVEGQSGSGAFLELTSARDARLIGAASDAAERVEIHRSSMVDGRMTMRPVDHVDLPAGQPVAFEHGLHLMLIGLRRRLQPGQVVTLHLRVQETGGTRAELEVAAPVRPLDATGP